MEIIVVTSLELLEAVQNLIDTVTRFDWATYEFKPYDFGTFERTAEYTKLAKDKNWLGEYDRARRGINKNHWSFWLKKDQIHFILIDPFAPPEWRMNSFVHEIAHMSLCEDATSKLIHKQLNYSLVKELRKKLDARADRGQLLTSAVHVIIFPADIIADRWVAEKSKNLLVDSLEQACSVWSKAGKDAVRLPHSLGPLLLCLRQYLSMQLKLSLAKEYDVPDKASTLTTIARDFEKAELVKLVVDRDDLWKLASRLRIPEYTARTMKLIRRLAKTVPLKSDKTAYMPPLQI